MIEQIGPSCRRCQRAIDGSIFDCPQCSTRYCDGCYPDWGQCDECDRGFPLKVGTTADELVAHDRVWRHVRNRQATFLALVDALKLEETDWSRALVPDKATEIRSLFEWSWGVRCASELAIGYLAIKALACRLAFGADFVWPERPCDARKGRMDLWVGATKDSRDGLGIEFKFLMGQGDANTVAAQAGRLQAQESVSSAAFILWGHGIDKDSRMHPDQLFAPLPTADGWTKWKAWARRSIPAYHRGETTLTVWMNASWKPAGLSVSTLAF